MAVSFEGFGLLTPAKIILAEATDCQRGKVPQRGNGLTHKQRFDKGPIRAQRAERAHKDLIIRARAQKGPKGPKCPTGPVAP